MYAVQVVRSAPRNAKHYVSVAVPLLVLEVRLYFDLVAPNLARFVPCSATISKYNVQLSI